MGRSQAARGLGVTATVLVALFAAVHGSAALGGCAKGSDGDSFGEDEGQGRKSGSGASGPSGGPDDPGDLPSGTGTSDGPSGATTSGGSTSAASTGTPLAKGDCCVAGSSPGCADASVEQCVCAQDDVCCSASWDDQCVAEVDELGCGNCGTSTSGASSSGGNPAGDCCTPGSGPGCGDPSVEQCVCQQDSVCCSSVWDDTCVDEVDQLGCGSCGGSSSSGGGGGECCIPTGGPGCPDPMVEQCVCTFDSYCCTDDWDDTCVQEVLQFGCGIC